MTGQSKKYLAIILLSLMVVGCALIYTTDRYLFKFTHKTHIENEIACEQCHTDISKSKSASDNNLPKKDACKDCHEVDNKDQCNLCHARSDKARKLKQRGTDLIFSHELHVKDNGMECKSCHINVNDSTKSTDKLIPKMETCQECHDTKSPNSNCEQCHTGLKDLVLKPKSHRNMNMFVTNHKRAVYTSSINYCQKCHKEETCLSCHEGRIDRNVHDRNFRYYHSLEAKSNPQSCDVCHRKQFCKECH